MILHSQKLNEQNPLTSSLARSHVINCFASDYEQRPFLKRSLLNPSAPVIPSAKVIGHLKSAPSVQCQKVLGALGKCWVSLLELIKDPPSLCQSFCKVMTAWSPSTSSKDSLVSHQSTIINHVHKPHRTLMSMNNSKTYYGARHPSVLIW